MGLKRSIIFKIEDKGIIKVYLLYFRQINKKKNKCQKKKMKQ